MSLVTITYNEVERIISITFTENLSAFLSLFLDTQYLMDNCLSKEGNVIYLSEEQFQTYIDYKKTIPMIVTIEIEENIERVEYALNFVLQLLQKELAEECEQLEKFHSLEQERAHSILEKKADELIQKAYREELVKKAQLDLYEYKKEHSSGFWYDDNISEGM